MRPDYAHFNSVALKTLSGGYLDEGIAPENLKAEAINRAEALVDRAEELLGWKLPTLRHGMRRGWSSPASPIWSNFGKERGLPISCNGSVMADSRSSILKKVAEIGEMSGRGAGTSLYMGNLRPFGASISSGGKSEGPVHFARLVQEQVQVISQSNVRRGNCAVYLDIEHDDIDRWMQMRSTTEGDHHAIQHLSFGVVIGDEWMMDFLKEPKGGAKRLLLAKIVNKRKSTGFPYIIFRDAANRDRHPRLVELELEIKASNLCTEIMQHSTPDESFVCDLSSINLLYWDEFKNTDFIREMIYFLDAVMTEYIRKIRALEKTDPDAFWMMEAALRHAERWRALGLGTLGWHSYLQSKLIPIESDRASELNIEIHQRLAVESRAASRYLALMHGEPEGLKGTGDRNVSVNALAPTQSSSVICGQASQSIEPWTAVVFVNDTAKVSFTQYNTGFVELARSRGQDTPDMWQSVLQRGGKVDHLDWLTDLEKEVYKPWVDMDQKILTRQNADRQKFIDQGISFNVMMPATAKMKDDVELIVYAWELGLKSLYYRRGVNKTQAAARVEACVACEA